MNVKLFEDEYWKVVALTTLRIPPVNFIIKNLRVSSAFQFVRIVKSARPLMYHYNLLINKKIFPLNPKMKILKAFRHELIHLWQYHYGARCTHTKEFQRIAIQIKASYGHNLIMPKSKYKTYYYICPQGCQQFSTSEEPEVQCGFCTRKMKKYNSAEYKKYKKEQKEAIQNFKQGKDDGIDNS